MSGSAAADVRVMSGDGGRLLTLRDRFLHFLAQHLVHSVGQRRAESVAELLAQLLLKLLLMVLTLRQNALQSAL